MAVLWKQELGMCCECHNRLSSICIAAMYYVTECIIFRIAKPSGNYCYDKALLYIPYMKNKMHTLTREGINRII